ncbi:phosphate acetyltransferase [Candidatus Woesearchaeota archaeon]|nr:phosphate acetyltransferase [Candidatus Woesearchaeota archaeon]
MTILDTIENKAKGSYSRIIFPEAEDERILKAVSIAAKKGFIAPVLVGNPDKIKKTALRLKIQLKDFEIIEQSNSKRLDDYALIYSKKTNTNLRTANTVVLNPLFFSACALAAGDVDAMVAGAVYTSAEVIAVSKKIIGLQKGVSVPSSFFIMTIPDYKAGENGALLYADASVNPNPTAEQLADIAIASGHTAKKLLKWKPRIAMLSFSTKGSAEHPDVCKVIKAAEIAKKKARNMAIDGELQADSALVMSVAKKKIKGKTGPVAGKANILIFPDLDAGNIAYKLTQRLAKANAYGPLLQGFAKPVSDLSRGATVEDIVGVIAILSVWSKRWKK